MAVSGLTVLVSAAVALAPAGSAAPQVFQNQIDVSLSGIDQCGFVVDAVTQGTNTFQGWVHFDAYCYAIAAAIG